MIIASFQLIDKFGRSASRLTTLKFAHISGLTQAASTASPYHLKHSICRRNLDTKYFDETVVRTRGACFIEKHR